MTLQAHKFIDCLLGNPGTPWAHPPLVSKIGALELAADIRRAEKFDFQAIPLEPVAVEEGAYQVPTLTKQEREFWVTGLVPLPGPVCWYEFMLGGSRCGILIQQIGKDWQIHRFDIVEGTMSYDGKAVLLHPKGLDEIEIEFMGSKGLDSRASRVLNESNVATARLVIYLTLMLSSRTTEKETIPPPPALNKKRIKQGKEPLHVYRTVNIVPQRYRQSDSRGGTHASPKLHWRRSHIRHYDHQTPGSTYAPTALHDGTYGWWVVVIARQLVGREELGTVTHNYKVMT